MVADHEKYNWAVSMQDSLSISRFLVANSGRTRLPMKWLVRRLERKVFPQPWTPLAADKDEEPRPGRWYNAGIKRTCTMLIANGYEIVDPDVETNHRDPIIHFAKP